MARHRLCTRADLPEVGQAKRFDVPLPDGGLAKIALVRTPQGLFAMDDHCPHRSGPMSEGWVELPPAPEPKAETASPGLLVCPWHQWAFDLRTGACKNIPGQKIAVFELFENEEVIEIDLGV